MRRLTDVTITREDRPAPPRAKRVYKPAQPRALTRPRRRRALPVWLKRVRLALISAFALAVVVTPPLWLARSSTPARLERQAIDGFIELSSRGGLRVADILVEGRKRLPAAALAAALGVGRGDAILGLDLAAARNRIAALPSVKSVTIERRLPDRLYVLIAEREPIAVWQYQGHYTLVDREGAPVGDDVADFPDLPLVVGEGAPDHVAALLDMLASASEIAKRVKASQWISERRWNIQVGGPAGDIEVRLPEDDPAAAWLELARLEDQQKLLERALSVIDMRLPDRLVLRVPVGIAPPVPVAPTVRPRRKAPGRDA
jgi:cell division protein FtsQ